MQVQWGHDAAAKRRNEILPVITDTAKAVNAHAGVFGMTGAGKTHTLRSMINQMLETAIVTQPRFHVFDVHGDIEVEGASTVLFSEQTQYGMNPLAVNPDPHYGGVRKRVQGFIRTMNRVMRQLGTKQEAALRNVLFDLYEAHGFDKDDPSTWNVDENAAQFVGNGSNDRLYLDIPRAEKDVAKSVANIRWDGEKVCWWIAPDEYKGAITRWPAKTAGRTHPTIKDALNMARRILEQSFLGSDQEAVTYLQAFSRATGQYQSKVLTAMRRGTDVDDADKLEGELDKSAAKAIESFTRYVNSIKTGKELDQVMKYDSPDVLKSVVDRLENLAAIGVFKSLPPPFDPEASVWRYNIKPLGLEERKLFVLFRLEELFMRAVQRGEQKEIVEVAIVDEAHIYCDDDEQNILLFIAREARKFGLALICASQSPTHFPEDFLAAIGTKVILGIDETYWTKAVSKMNVTLEGLKWIKLQSSMLVQIKEKGNAKNDWKWTIIA